MFYNHHNCTKEGPLFVCKELTHRIAYSYDLNLRTVLAAKDSDIEVCVFREQDRVILFICIGVGTTLHVYSTNL